MTSIGRLILEVDQVAAAIEGFFWPKIFWDFLTTTLDSAVKPVPALQIINLLLGIFMFLLEWPLPWIAGSFVHRSLEFRLVILPLTTLAAALLYQATNPAIYYLVAMVVYFWAYSEGEVNFEPPVPALRRRLVVNETFLAHLREALDPPSAGRSFARIMKGAPRLKSS